MASKNTPPTIRDATTRPRLSPVRWGHTVFGDQRGKEPMPDFFDQAKKLASEHSDLVDKGLDQAAYMAKEKTGGRFDDHIDTAEEKLEGFLGMNTQDDDQ